MNNRKFTENEPWAHFVSSTYGKLDLVLLSRIATTLAINRFKSAV